MQEHPVDAGQRRAPPGQPQHGGRKGDRRHAREPLGRGRADEGADERGEQDGVLGAEADVGDADLDRRLLAGQAGRELAARP